MSVLEGLQEIISKDSEYRVRYILEESAFKVEMYFDPEEQYKNNECDFCISYNAILNDVFIYMHRAESLNYKKILLTTEISTYLSQCKDELYKMCNECSLINRGVK